MKKRGFRLLAFILCSLMTLSFCSCFGFLKNAFEQGVQYKLSDDGEYAIAADYKGWNGTVEILSVYQGKPVREIGPSAFSYSLLARIIIPDSVTKIDAHAFASTHLREVTIPDSVTEIGAGVFANCRSLRSITLPSSITSIKATAFDSCANLESIDIPNGVTKIGSEAFRLCESLTEIIIPDSVERIEDHAFNGCINLFRVTLGQNLTSIEDGAFGGCWRLAEVINRSTTITVEKGSENHGYVGTCALDVFTQTENVTSNLSFENECLVHTGEVEKTVVGYYGKEQNLVLPADVTRIHPSAFYSNAVITSITIPKSVTYIGNFAFFGTSNIKNFYYMGDIESWCKLDFSEKVSQFFYVRNFYIDNVLINDLVIPNTVTEIKNYAFQHYRNLTSVRIPDSVTSIGDGAFSHCKNLSHVTLPNTITTIGKYAFVECPNLTEIHFEGTVEEWNALQASITHQWKYRTLEKVICSDGEVNL